MSQFTGLLSATGLGSIQNLGVVDVTPNSVNWNDVTNPYIATTNTQTISGIETTINLTISYINNSVAGTIFNPAYSKNGASFTPITSNPFTISVSNGDTLSFSQEATLVVDRTFTVKNASGGDVVLDTFRLVAYAD